MSSLTESNRAMALHVAQLVAALSVYKAEEKYHLEVNGTHYIGDNAPAAIAKLMKLRPLRGNDGQKYVKHSGFYPALYAY